MSRDPATPRSGDGDQPPAEGQQVYEVFRQEREGEPMRHGGNLVAPDEHLALHYAREFYGRRGESLRLWVVPRGAILELDNEDLLQPVLERSHKHPGGFILKGKLEAARARAARR